MSDRPSTIRFDSRLLSRQLPVHSFRRALIAAAALGCSVGTTPARAANASAPMVVTVTVVRSCTVGSEVTGGVTLACSTGTNRVLVGAGSAPHVLSAGRNPIAAAGPDPAPADTRPDAYASLITLNF